MAGGDRRPETEPRSNVGAIEMSETPIVTSPDEDGNTISEPKEPAISGRDYILIAYGVTFLLLIAGIVYLWVNSAAPADAAAETQAVSALSHRVDELDQRLARDEQRAKQISPDDLTKLASRLDAVSSKVADETHIGSQLDVLSGRIAALSGRQESGQDADKQRLDDLSGHLAALEKAAASQGAASKQVQQIARVQQAGIALRAGRPVGDLPNAPPALAQFAHKAPPTEASLRLAFPAAEQRALSAKQPDESGAPFVDRMLDKAQELVTVRKGDVLIVGDTSAGILAQARAALDAGDLSTAVASVEKLKGNPRAAMSSWLAQAKALLDAQAALADMAGQA
jgi:hypothetical protein